MLYKYDKFVARDISNPHRLCNNDNHSKIILHIISRHVPIHTCYLPDPPSPKKEQVNATMEHQEPAF